jgi:hypothetical protein
MLPDSCTEAARPPAAEPATTAQRLGLFYKGLIAEGITESMAHALVLRVFEAELNGLLVNTGRSLADFR